MSLFGSYYDCAGDVDKHTTLVGWFAIISAHLEEGVENILLNLLQTSSEYGGAAVRYIPLSEQISLIKTITEDAHGKESEMLSSLRSILGDAKHGVNNRNTYVHAIYDRSDDHKILRKNLRKGMLYPAKIDISISTMEKDVLQAVSAMEKLYGFMIDHNIPDLPLSARSRRDALVKSLRSHSQDRTGIEGDPPPESSQE